MFEILIICHPCREEKKHTCLHLQIHAYIFCPKGSCSEVWHSKAFKHRRASEQLLFVIPWKLVGPSEPYPNHLNPNGSPESKCSQVLPSGSAPSARNNHTTVPDWIEWQSWLLGLSITIFDAAVGTHRCCWFILIPGLLKFSDQLKEREVIRLDCVCIAIRTISFSSQFFFIDNGFLLRSLILGGGWFASCGAWWPWWQQVGGRHAHSRLSAVQGSSSR